MLTSQDVEKAQQSWGSGIVEIGRLHTEGGDLVAFTSDFIKEHYAYDSGSVLFKPTKAAEVQFRDTFDKALSYFIANNGACAEDKGFALNPWTAVRFENHQIQTFSETAISMGNYFFTGPDGGETQVEYVFGYKSIAGKLKIFLHHSSVPFSA